MNWYKEVYRHRQAFPVLATDSIDEPALRGPDHSPTSPTVSSADGYSPSSPAFSPIDYSPCSPPKVASPTSPNFLRGSGGAKSPAYVATVYPPGAYGTPPHSLGNGDSKPRALGNPAPDLIMQPLEKYGEYGPFSPIWSPDVE